MSWAVNTKLWNKSSSLNNNISDRHLKGYVVTGYWKVHNSSNTCIKKDFTVGCTCFGSGPSSEPVLISRRFFSSSPYTLEVSEVVPEIPTPKLNY